MATETIAYRGGLIRLSRFGSGWRALIYLPGATMCQSDIPNTLDPAGRDETLEAAKTIMDKALGRES